MVFLARRILHSKAQAYAVVLLLAALSIVFKPVGILLGAAVSFIALSIGMQEALILSATVTLALWGLNALLDFVHFSHILFLLAVFIVPGFLSVAVLRHSSVIGGMLLVHGMWSAVLVIGLGAVISNAVWLNLLEAISQQLAMQLDTQQLSALAQLMNSFVGMLVVFLSVSSMLLALRWTRLVDAAAAPGFGDMQVGRFPAVGMVAIMAAALLDNTLAISLLGVIVALCVLQGIGLVHYWVKAKQASRAWLFAFYSLLLLREFFLVVAVVGLIDNWFNFRKFIKQENTQ